MSDGDESWVPKWLARKLADTGIAARVTDSNRVEADWKGGRKIHIITMARKLVAETDVVALAKNTSRPDFIVNVNKDGFFTGTAIRVAKSANIGLGSYGDLLGALHSTEDPRNYENKETDFIHRALRQHTRVRDWTRLEDRRYRIEREGNLAPVVVVFLNEYDLTAEAVRAAADKYGRFQAIVMTNPNGRVSESAKGIMNSLSIRCLRWGEFLGDLNKSWR